MFCCCTTNEEAHEVVPEVLQKDALWCIATAEGSPGYIIEAASSKSAAASGAPGAVRAETEAAPAPETGLGLFAPRRPRPSVAAAAAAAKSSAADPGVPVEEEAPVADEGLMSPLLSQSPGSKEEAAGSALDEGLFSAVLTRSSRSESFGLFLDFSDGKSLYVCSVDERGRAGAYNATAPALRKLWAGDSILAVNGVKGNSSELFQAVKASGSRVELKVRRPLCMNVTVKKGGQGIGLGLLCSKQGASVSVCTIMDGAVKSAGLDIRPGDRIVRVNGQKDAPCELLSRLGSLPEPVLTILRCPEVAAAYEKGFVAWPFGSAVAPHEVSELRQP